MPLDVQFRKATLQDATRLAKMNQRLIEDEKHDNRMTLAELTERMRGWLDGEYSATIVEEAPGVAIAYCLYRKEERCYYLRQLFVERSHRRNGVATALLDRMYAEIWLDKPVRLEVLAHNEGAIEFYKRYGFTVRCLEMER